MVGFKKRKDVHCGLDKQGLPLIIQLLLDITRSVKSAIGFVISKFLYTEIWPFMQKLAVTLAHAKEDEGEILRTHETFIKRF